MIDLVGFPKTLTLLNPITSAKHRMRIQAPVEVESTPLVDTGGKRDKNPLRRKVMDYKVQCAVPEAVFLSSIKD